MRLGSKYNINAGNTILLCGQVHKRKENTYQLCVAILKSLRLGKTPVYRKPGSLSL